jgi:acetylornithine deacetylase/succinyl-diaminopimelate desuccinylase-like protein
MSAQNYIQTHQQRFINELIEWLKIPSISTEANRAGDMLNAAEFLKNKLTAAGLDNAQLMPTKGNPVVYADKIIGAHLPTVLVYGHYDVQPTDSSDGRAWSSPPFEPVIKNENIYARGATDDKGQVYIHVKAIETLMNNGGVPCNVKFMIEGEEEIGSPNLAEFATTHKEHLKADIILISDTSIIDNETPSITVGLRGLSYVEVEVSAANKDLHSGVYGGAVANPAQVLCQMIASLKDDKNRITIPHFYDKVIELPAEERAELAKEPFDLAKYKEELGIDDVVGEEGYTTIERTAIRPTLEVNGIWGGFTGVGSKTVLPAKANAKISMRLVPNQSSEEITKLFTEHFTAIAPKGVKVKVTPHHGGEPYLVATNSKAYKAAEKAYEKHFNKKPIPTRSGGSIPIVIALKQILGIDSLMMGFGLDSDDAHSPDEHFGIYNFIKGIETITSFYDFYAGNSK